MVGWVEEKFAIDKWNILVYLVQHACLAGGWLGDRAIGSGLAVGYQNRLQDIEYDEDI